MSLDAKLQQASVEYRELQAALSEAVEARGRLHAQLSENELVKEVPFGRIKSAYFWPNFSRNLIDLRQRMWYTSSLAQF